MAATALGGIAVGTSFDKSIVQLTAWRSVGAVPWATYSREADLRNSLVWYPPLGIGTMFFSIAAAVAVHRDRTASRSAAVPTHIAALLAIGHMLATARAAPNMLSVKRTDESEALRAALDSFTRWQMVRTGLETVKQGKLPIMREHRIALKHSHLR